MIAGTQHGGRAGAHDRSRTQRQSAQSAQSDAGRARAAEWRSTNGSVSGKAPPASRVPTLAAGTLVEPDKTGFPAVPGAAVVQGHQPGGPAGRLGEPKPADKAYRTLVCKVDADGNEAAGIRLPDIAVPLATYYRLERVQAALSKGRDSADRDGSCLPFASTRRRVMAAGDPRPLDRRALRERRRLRRQGARPWSTALLKDRLLLAEDADRYLERARDEPRVAP